MKAIINGKIITEGEILKGKALIFDEKIVDIVDEEKINKNDCEIIDAKGNYVSPGFIDIHIHGLGGSDTMDANFEALQNISKTLAQCGTTAFLPTTMTMSRDRIYMALENIKSNKDKVKGAKVLGVHLEGPFISKKYKGAQDDKYIIPPSYDFIMDYIDVIKIITVAPEVDEEFKFIDSISKIKDIVISMGHTSANYEVAVNAIKKGISHATHTFNAMSPFNHREPGAVGAVFNTDITCEVIADLIHVHPEALRLLIKIKGIDKVVLITDSMRAGCMEEGIYDLGGQKVFVDKTSARLEDGTLAGSILTLNRAVYNVVNKLGINIVDAVRMASLNPAKVIKEDCRIGSIQKGKDADIIIFNEDIDVMLTIEEGKIVFTA
ncbi:N-acetylglucosamine-6-phosphate deacetylase [Caloramator proteoclasticus]|uniref:N-acetylglucosamine-6-phosphate deacetylase n=1 Tax=Caloramator proteoclasticus DSM 10124 TaxID=1121262 RepID=A0A1M4T289_9CLOT|nr:N-acetylglucosamine-6-phosphate deacetylase [Caloramator proteoclasticus]SHE38508.1 N-acetylglucosamine-6-phosphate deacetylase [Caloramator proteoclasticus DSM 10124]